MGGVSAGAWRHVFLHAVLAQGLTRGIECGPFVYLDGNFATARIKLIKLIKITTVTDLNHFKVP